MKWLRERSTIGGLVGLVVSASAATGADWANDPTTVSVVTEAAPTLALGALSVLALFVKEVPRGD
jgi:hypothetical protein